MTKSGRESMEILEAYGLTGCAWSAAELAGCDPKTITRYVAKRDGGGDPLGGGRRARLVDPFVDKIEELVDRSEGRIRADTVHLRLVGMGFGGDERSTRRAVAEAKAAWRAGHRRRRYRPWVPEPGMWLQFDWGAGPRIGGRGTNWAAHLSALSRLPRHQMTGGPPDADDHAAALACSCGSRGPCRCVPPRTADVQCGGPAASAGWTITGRGQVFGGYPRLNEHHLPVIDDGVNDPAEPPAVVAGPLRQQTGTAGGHTGQAAHPTVPRCRAGPGPMWFRWRRARVSRCGRGWDSAAGGRGTADPGTR